MQSETDIVIRIRAEVAQLRAALRDESARISKMVKPSVASYQKLATIEQQVVDRTQDLNKAMGRTPFAGYAMSIMFFGMALERIFTQIWKFGTKAFNDIQHSVEGTVTQSDMLEGSMKFLGYTIGQALEPVLMWLIPIIDAISDWVDKNPELTATLITLGITLGALFAVGGAMNLAVNGFRDLSMILTGLMSIKGGGWLATLSLSSPWVLAILAVAGGILAFNKALKDSPAFKENFNNEIMKPLTDSFKDLWSSVNDLFKEIFGGTGIIDTIGGLFLILARTTLSVLVPALVILAETWGNVFKAARAAWLAITGEGDKAAKVWDSIDWDSSAKALSAAVDNMKKLMSSLAAGQITISGQMDVYNREAAMKNLQEGAYSPAPKGAPYAPITIQTLNIYSNEDPLEDLRNSLTRRDLGAGIKLG